MGHEEVGRRIYEAVYGRAPRHTWFRQPRDQRWGPMFGWTLEPIEGRYGSMVWWPRGRGSRSNRAERWQLVEELTGVHDTRREAKARALRLYRAHFDHGCSLAELKDGSYLEKTRAA